MKIMDNFATTVEVSLGVILKLILSNALLFMDRIATIIYQDGIIQLMDSISLIHLRTILQMDHIAILKMLWTVIMIMDQIVINKVDINALQVMALIFNILYIVYQLIIIHAIKIKDNFAIIQEITHGATFMIKTIIVCQLIKVKPAMILTQVGILHMIQNL
jgi:hypothetical protein